MTVNILAVGDVVAQSGLDCLSRNLRRLRREEHIDFTVVNGENAAGNGLLPHQAEEILDAGADVITLGHHTWGKLRIADTLADNPCLLRPANFAPRSPGRGWRVYDGPKGLRIGVVNLIGRVSMDPNVENPFTTADAVLKQMEADVVLVDFHAEATSEKLAMGWYLDGRVSALWGTHTHVPTADGQVLPGGTGYITDLGMTGPALSVLGVKPEQSINKFLGGLPQKYEAADGPGKLEAAVFTLDTVSGKCVSVRQLRLEDGRHK